jgi:uncharacterized protein YdeI (YjbR/CyaY-like superfamily)
VAAGKNVVGLVVFKSYFGLWFFEGARLEDKERARQRARGQNEINAAMADDEGCVPSVSLGSTAPP